MHIESLDPRRLFAAGLDATFADHGQYAFPATFFPDTAVEESIVAGDNGSVFVVGSDRKSHYSVTKLDKNGRLITKFGDNGYAKIPFKPEHTAYDAANGLLYFSRQSSVGRLKPTGAFDTDYGESGLFGYTLAKPPGDDASASTSIQALAPQADGSLVVGIDRRSKPQDSDTTQDLSLIKVRPGGTRDRRYGTNGVVRLLDGTIGPIEDNGQTDRQRLNIGVFADLQANERGLTTAVLRSVDGTREIFEGSLPGTDTADRGRFFVKSRVVTRSGNLDPAAAHAWKIADNTADTEPPVGVLYAGWDGRTVHAVVIPSTGSATVPNPTYLYTLRPGKKPAPQPFPAAGLDGVFQFTRSADGTYLAADYGLAITRLRSDFLPDTTFGDAGVIRPTRAEFTGYYSTTAYGDADGRVFTFEYLESGTVIERFR